MIDASSSLSFFLMSLLARLMKDSNESRLMKTKKAWTDHRERGGIRGRGALSFEQRGRSNCRERAR